MSKRSRETPSLSRRLLRTFHGERRLEETERDLDEVYRRELARSGPLRARLRYWQELLGIVFWGWRASGPTLPHSTRRTGRPLADAVTDARYTARALLRSPGFTAVAVLTLALGIGANTAIFSVVNSVLLQPLPFEDPDRVVMLRGRLVARDIDKFPLSDGHYADLLAHTSAFESLAALRFADGAIVAQGTTPEQTDIAFVTFNFFSLLGVEPAIGRGFAADDLETSADVVVISHALWQRGYGSDPAILGRTLRVRGEPNEIIGVLPAGLLLHIPDRFGDVTTGTDVWQARRINLDPARAQRTEHRLAVFGRLSPTATFQQAQGEVDVLAAAGREEFAAMARTDFHMDVVPVHNEVVNDVRPTLFAFMAAVGLVLLIACANVANLMLVRSSVRQGEIAVRAALGAGRGRLLRQLLTESTMLSLAGAAAGATLAYGGVELLLFLDPAELPRLGDVRVDITALVFSLALGVLTALLFGLLPALSSSGGSLNQTLQAGGRGGGTRRRIGNVLIVAEVALSLVLLVGAGLLLRSFASLTNVDPGFRTEGVLSFRADLSPDESDALAADIGTLPGVEVVGRSELVPLDGGQRGGPFVPDTITWEDTDEYGRADWRYVTHGYFEAMGINLAQGRFFEETDGRPMENNELPLVAVVDKRLAEQVWPDENPVGRFLRRGIGNSPETPWQVIGVVEPTRKESLGEDGIPTIYFLAAGTGLPSTFVVRTNGPPTSLVAPIRAKLLALNPENPMYDVQTMRSYTEGALAPAQFALLLTGAFAVAALILAAVGLYGIISYSVGQRTREMGIRTALGARSADVVRLVVKQGLTLTLTGVALGLGGAWWLSRSLSAWLYEVSPADPLTYGAIAVLLTAVATLSCWLPASRAARVDPSTALQPR